MRLNKSIVLLPLLAWACCWTGCWKSDDVENMVVPELMIEVRGVEYGAMRNREVVLPDGVTKIFVERSPIVGAKEIVNVEMVKVELGPALLVQLSDRGARELYRQSVTNNGSRVVFMANGQAKGARRLDGAISDGQFYTFVDMTEEELGQMVLDIKESIPEIQRK